MSLTRQLGELARTRRDIRRAERRLAECARDGHRWDDDVPSPPGRRYCGRCHTRYPARP